MNAIEIRSLKKSFRGLYALDGLDMTVPQGAIYGFIGENGSGKMIRELTAEELDADCPVFIALRAENMELAEALLRRRYARVEKDEERGLLRVYDRVPPEARCFAPRAAPLPTKSCCAIFCGSPLNGNPCLIRRQRKESQHFMLALFSWRRDRDLNPGRHHCLTRFRIVRVQPLRHLCKGGGHTDAEAVRPKCI